MRSRAATPRSSSASAGRRPLDTAKQVAVRLGDPSHESIEHYMLGAPPLPGRRRRRHPDDGGHRRRGDPHVRPDRHEGRKVWTWGDELLPDVVVLDPVATATMPPEVTAATGLDAFVHALEAATGQRRDERPLEPALHAIRLVASTSRRGHRRGRPARAAMQEAAFLAGCHRRRRDRHRPRHRPRAAALPTSPTVSRSPSGWRPRWPGTSRVHHVVRPGRRGPRRGARRPTDWRVLPLAVDRRRSVPRRRRPACHPLDPSASPRRWSPRRTCRCTTTTAAPGDDAGTWPNAPSPCGPSFEHDPGMSAITRIDISHHRLPLDPPFPAAWDPRPAHPVPGDDRAGPRRRRPRRDRLRRRDVRLRRLSSATSSARTRSTSTATRAVLANIEFHAGRPWPLDVALWDLAGQIHDRPVWALLGGRDRAGPRLRLVRRAPAARRRWSTVARRVRRARLPGAEGALRARRSSTDDLAVVRAVRDAVGDALELMVDCNQGWRMPWDTAPPWDVERATEVADDARRRARVLDGGAAAPRRLRRARRAAAAGRHPRSPAAS